MSFGITIRVLSRRKKNNYNCKKHRSSQGNNEKKNTLFDKG